MWEKVPKKMDILPGVRKKILQRKIEKLLDASAQSELSAEEISLLCCEISIEGFVGRKLEQFFEKLGQYEVRGLHDIVISQVESSLIKESLKWAKGNKLKVARMLGVHRNTLRNKIKKLKIKD